MRKLSFGIELELADIPCNREIPEEIGSWETNIKNKEGYYIGPETCIINSNWECVDPLKEKCKLGGEIHIVPSYDVKTLVERIKKIFELFPEAKSFYPSDTHIHIGIPDWTLDECQNIFKYCSLYERELQEKMFPDKYVDWLLDDWGDHTPLSDEFKEYILNSRCKLINPEAYDNIGMFLHKDNLCELWGKKGMYYWPKGVIYRTGKVVAGVRCHCIHLQHLFCHNTVEFRNIASTTDIKEIESMLLFCEKFITEALKGADGQPLSEYVDDYIFPDWFKATPSLEMLQYWFDNKEMERSKKVEKHFKSKNVV